jgi:predicted amidohydrolase
VSGGALRLRVEQHDCTLGDVGANLARIAAAAEAAAADGVELLLTPELSVTGYDLRDAVHALARPAAGTPFPSLPAAPDLVVGTVEEDGAGIPCNAALHLRGGRVLHRHRKVYLPTYGMFDEGRYFGRGSAVRAYDAGEGWRLGLLVCEDLWHPALAWLLAAQGANLLLVQSAAPGRGTVEGGEAGGRFASAERWELLARAAAASYGVYVALANRAGVEGPFVFAGGSMVVGPDGRVLARAGDTGEARLTVDLSLAEVAAARRPYAHLRDDDPALVARELARVLAERG